MNKPSSSPLAKPLPPLSRREMEVASLVAAGLSNREIAAALGIGHRTVATHIEHILRKLKARRRTQIATWAFAMDLSRPPT